MEKITIRRSKFFNNQGGKNYFYITQLLKKTLVRLFVLSKYLNNEDNDLGLKKMAMYIAASNPLSIDKNDLEKEIIDKEEEIIKVEIQNSGKKR